MRAMLLDAPGTRLREAEIRPPEPRPGQVRIRVGACGVCRTDLHVRDGELPDPKLPLILGHQIVGTVVGGGRLRRGARVGVPWLGWTCGECRYCRSGPGEPLRPRPLHRLHPRRRLRRGGRGRRALLLPAPEGRRRGARAAPLRGPHRLSRAACGRRRRTARPLRLRRRRAPRRAARAAPKAAASSRSRGRATRRRSRSRASSGAEWAGAVGERPEELDAAIIFAPAGELVPEALGAVARAASSSAPGST